MGSVQVALDSWFVRHLTSLKTTIRVVFGIVWGVDGALKFQPGLSGSIVDMVNPAAAVFLSSAIELNCD